MPGPMTEVQVAFWTELLAQFPPQELSTKRIAGREFTWVDSRALFNRLDLVCTPMGWKVEYTDGPDGKKCRASILVPGPDVVEWGYPNEDDGWVWVTKEDGAGHEEMADEDNAEKSGYTNAARRVFQNAFGIARELYPKARVNPYANYLWSLTGTPQPTVSSPPPPVAKVEERVEVDPRQFEKPKAGNTFYSWLSGLKRVFGVDMAAVARKEATKLGFGGATTSWTQEQVNEIFAAIVQYCKTLPNYNNQFGKVSPGKSTTTVLGTNLADLRKEIKAKLTDLYVMQSGHKPNFDELKSAFGVIALEAKNADGVKGEIPDALAHVTDVEWLRDMIRVLNEMIAEERSAIAEGNDEGNPPF